MIGSFRNFLSSLVLAFVILNLNLSLLLSHWEIPVEYRLMTCLPKAFPVFSTFSVSSRCLHSAYVLLIIKSLVLSTLPYVHLPLINAPRPCLWHSLILLGFFAAKCLPMVYQQHHQKTHYCLICLQHQPLSLFNVEIATLWRTISDMKAVSTTLL